ncbi:plasmid mobilization relaxosome protein MobC [uncultured Paracoccus sp.]|uniref:plasmid mobilization relaxosome protein MobC n=1 Tax=uncultured Paracoccus sp. TaxID=189685 RepID=UPI0025E46B29|nr:plasmid mobilization relaxosome protein MobC [uncultured Paracoccus sp.]
MVIRRFHDQDALNVCQKQAKAAGLSESALIRALIEDAPIVSAAEQTARQQTNAQLARIGNNLNQLARHANSWRGNADAALLAAEVAKIRAELRAIFDSEAEKGESGC